MAATLPAVKTVLVCARVNKYVNAIMNDDRLLGCPLQRYFTFLVFHHS